MCRDADRLVSVSRGGDPRALQSYDAVHIRFGERAYDLRIGGEGEIGVNYFRRSGRAADGVIRRIGEIP